MKALYSILIISFLSSCSFFQSKKPDDTFLYLRGEKKADAETYEKKLTRSTTMGGGFYSIAARPITSSYLKAVNQKLADRRGLTNDEKQYAQTKANENFLHNKTCFHFEYEVVRFEEASQLKNWKIFYVDKNGGDILLTWKESDLNTPAVRSKSYRAGERHNTWLGKGSACASFTTDFKSGFALKVKPDFVQFPFSSETLITWDFPEKVIDYQGKEVWTEDRRKTHKGYRGW